MDPILGDWFLKLCCVGTPRSIKYNIWKMSRGVQNKTIRSYTCTWYEPLSNVFPYVLGLFNMRAIHFGFSPFFYAFAIIDRIALETRYVDTMDLQLLIKMHWTQGMLIQYTFSMKYTM